MLSAEGCRKRRQRLLQMVDVQKRGGMLLLADPAHLMYLANFHVDPISSANGFGGALVIGKDGHSTLVHDNKLPASVDQAHVDERRVAPWYDGQNPQRGPRELAWAPSVLSGKETYVIHDSPGAAGAAEVVTAIAELRRQKDPDEIELLKRCMRATEAGHAWARANIRAGMTELDIYCGVNSACIQAAGQSVIVYGDFAVSPGPERRGGPPTDRVLVPKDLFIMDYSVVIGGYRSDFTNTLVVGKEPNADQSELFHHCLEAMQAGEKEVRAGVPCLQVYLAVRQVFEKAGVAEHFPHHAGHGLGLMHPEAPYLVRHANETLMTGDVITLEPGLYVAGVGGLRIENNYLVTSEGFERLSHHEISLV